MADIVEFPKSQRCCVYTVMTGGYERLSEIAVAKDSSWDFICFTDNPAARSDTWEVRQFSPPFSHDAARNSRVPKACPHRFLGDYDLSLYIDNTVELKLPPEKFVADMLTSPAHEWVGIRHSFRETLLDEFNRVLRLGLDDPTRIREQFNVYRAHMPELLQQRPLWAGMILRRHHLPAVVEAGERWLAHICRYSRRDQLSLLHALAASGVGLHVLELDNRASHLHAWDNKPPSRDRSRRKQSWKAMLPPSLLAYYHVARLLRRALRQELRLDE